MPKKITQYEAKDGTRHNSMDAAVTYEGMLDLYKYVDDNHIYCGSSESSVDGQAFGLWLQSNPRIFVKLLPADVPETEGEADRNGDEGYFPDGN